MNVAISKEAAQAIVLSIVNRCEEQGLSGDRAARLLAIKVAADVREIIQEELNPEPTLGTADVWHQGSKQHYRARLLEKITPEQFYFDPTEE